MGRFSNNETTEDFISEVSSKVAAICEDLQSLERDLDQHEISISVENLNEELVREYLANDDDLLMECINEKIQMNPTEFINSLDNVEYIAECFYRDKLADDDTSDKNKAIYEIVISMLKLIEN